MIKGIILKRCTGTTCCCDLIARKGALTDGHSIPIKSGRKGTTAQWRCVVVEAAVGDGQRANKGCGAVD